LFGRVHRYGFVKLSTLLCGGHAYVTHHFISQGFFVSS